MNKKIIWFIISVLLLSCMSAFAFKSLRLNDAPMTAVMIFPMILAALFILFSKEDSFSDIGWRFPPVRFFFIGVFLPVGQLGLVLAIDAALNLISYNGEHLLAHMPTPHIGLNLILCLPGMFMPFLLLPLPNFVVGWINHLSEEFAWRGYLFRKISQSRTSYVKGILVSGAVWWVWHVPMFWLSPVLTQLRPEQIGTTVVVSFFALLGTASVYSWVYIRTGSIWAPTIMHFSWNLFRGVLTGRLADGAPGLFTGELWLINGEGLIGNIVSILVGGVFLYLIVRLDKKRQAQLLMEIAARK